MTKLTPAEIDELRAKYETAVPITWARSAGEIWNAFPRLLATIAALEGELAAETERADRAEELASFNGNFGHATAIELRDERDALAAQVAELRCMKREEPKMNDKANVIRDMAGSGYYVLRAGDLNTAANEIDRLTAELRDARAKLAEAQEALKTARFQIAGSGPGIVFAHDESSLRSNIRLAVSAIDAAGPTKEPQDAAR